jgi:hypothetical protein
MLVVYWQWLEAASNTGLKLFLILDGIDEMAHTRSSDDPIGFLPKAMPPGVRCILSSGPGNTLTSLAQRGCGGKFVLPLTFQSLSLSNCYRRIFAFDLHPNLTLHALLPRLLSFTQFRLFCTDSSAYSRYHLAHGRKTGPPLFPFCIDRPLPAATNVYKACICLSRRRRL